MASGWGITGSKGRCYDFWMDFSDCMSRCREPKDCALLREDYFECLHHSKENERLFLMKEFLELENSSLEMRPYVSKALFQFQRRNRVYKEEQRQLRAASQKAKGGGDDGHH